MTKIESNSQEDHSRNCRELIQSQQTLLLSTVSTQGEPECSYSPYVRDESGVFYIFVSDLATHTRNMLQTQRASVLFIRPEKEVQNLFARERVIFECRVNEVQQEDERYHNQLQIMNEKFGDTVELLRSLPDFHLLALAAVNGKYIAGFGQAFSINMEDGSLNLE